MPPSKKSPKKKQLDEKQKSLTSFFQDSKPKKPPAKPTPKKKTTLKEESKIVIDKNIPEKLIKEKPKPEKEKTIERNTQKSYFQGNDKLFGLKEDNIPLRQVNRESFSSKYIRYLIEKGEIVKDLESGLLLDVDYDGGQNKAYCKFYDLNTDEIKIWIDTTGHEPYCLSKKSISELKSLTYIDKIGNSNRDRNLTEYEGFERFEKFTRYDLLSDSEVTLTKIYGKTPTNIGGSGTNIRNILAENGYKAWEADIRYHLNYIFDTQLIPGLIYRIENGKIEKVDYEKSEEGSKRMADDMRILFSGEAKEMQEFSEKFLDIFLAPIPDIKRMAMDIEVSLGQEDFRIPDARQAKQAIISISFVASDGLKLVYVLEREGYTFDKLHKDFPQDAEVIIFKSEKTLLIESFRLMWEYPVLITFNGDNFDLNYMYHRAEKLKIEKDLNPIHVKRGFGIMSKAECDLRKGIHIDVFNFFFNRSISGYAFGGAYQSASLNAISDALLGEKKYEHEEEIHEMEFDVLTWYNLKDSLLTLELTKFNNSLVWNLIILLCRITKMPIHDMVRRQISTWIQNIFYFEHRRKEYLIPRRSEIDEVKHGRQIMSKANEDKFQGAYVIPPVPGIHFDAVVMDFASLYPSIIKEYNLSYETVLCSHQDDKKNIMKGTPYYSCTHKMGIFAYVIGFFRDIRVKYFKPKSNDLNLSNKQRSYYNTIQQALKVFINASYGVFGSLNFPLFCSPVAESTTAIGQYSIKETINKAEELGVKVLYGDTDSVFLLNPTKDQMKQISDWSKEELDLDLEEEKTYQFLALSDRKKNYIGIYKDTNAVDMKGLLAKKRNTPGFIKTVFNELINILKKIKNKEEFLRARKSIIKIIKQNRKKIGKEGEFSLEDYSININLRKSINSYDKTLPQHVRAAIALREATGREIQKGENIKFVKSNDKIGAKAFQLAKFSDLNVKKYRELLKSALEQLLDALGIDYEEIVLKGYQKKEESRSSQKQLF